LITVQRTGQTDISDFKFINIGLYTTPDNGRQTDGGSHISICSSRIMVFVNVFCRVLYFIILTNYLCIMHNIGKIKKSLIMSNTLNTVSISAIRLTGPFVTMVYLMITGDMLTFFVIYSVILSGFTQSFFFLYKGSPDVGTSLYKSYPSTWMALFQITMGDYNVSYGRFPTTQHV